MIYILGFAGAFVLLIVYLMAKSAQAGPLQLSGSDLERAIPVVRVTADRPGPGWQELGSRTTADGLNLKFDHDDDPEAEATLLAPDHQRSRGAMFSPRLTVRLGSDFETFHVHNRGWVFRASVRGTGKAVGKEILAMMKVRGNGSAYGGTVENDDDIDAPVGDWIQFAWAEILRVEDGGA